MNCFSVVKFEFSKFSDFLRFGIFALFFLTGVSISWAQTGVETTYTANCSSTPTTNLNEMQISQFVTYTGTGYGYTAATASWQTIYNPSGSAAVVVSGIPVGATIVAAYLETVQLDDASPNSVAGCYDSYNVNGVTYTGNVIGFGNMNVVWNNIAYGTTSLSTGNYDNTCTERLNITAAVAATGNGTYTIANNASSNPRGLSTASIIVVYQSLPSTTTTSVQIADGIFLWQTGDGAAPYLWLGDAPEPVSISFCGNGCTANPVSDTFTRIGGDQMVNDGVTLLEGSDTFDVPGTTNPPSVILTEPGGPVLGDASDAVGAGPSWADIDTYSLPPSVVTTGTTSLEYWMSHGLDENAMDHKVTIWLNALVNEVSCSPPVPTPTSTNTSTNTPTNTYTVTATNTASYTPSNTNTFTPTNSVTNTNTPTFTSTPTNTVTFTNTQTNSNTPTPTATYSVTNTATNSATPTNTNTSTNTRTVTSTSTNTATNTATNTVTNTVTIINTNTSTNTATNSATNTVTNTNTVTSSRTNTATNTATNTVTNTITILNTNTSTNTATNTATNTVTNTNTVTSSRTNTATNTATNTVTNTVTIIDTNTSTNTATNTATNTVTNTNTVTSSRTNTATNTATNTVTNTVTIIDTDTSTNTATNTATNTVTNSQTVTNTATATYTQTSTNTVTNTVTIIDTDTSTNTATNTSTNTVTNTPTVTNTETNTSTNTYTNTVTNTVTIIDTDTSTNTATNTATNTVTNSPTVSSTASSTSTNSSTPTTTNTDTVVSTETSTSTATSTSSSTSSGTATSSSTSVNTSTSTQTSSPTMTFTMLSTSTSTSTSTNTLTHTVTSTATNTASPTSTNTPSPTSTNTALPTNTSTPTVTATSTLGWGISKIASETQARANDVITYTIGVTITSNSVSGLVVTDTLPSSVTFTDFNSNNIVAGTFNASTDLLQWVMPSPLAPGIYQLKYQTTVNSVVVGNSIILNNAQMTAPGQGAINTSAPVTVLGSFTVKINVYNSAGEVVKTVLVQQFSQPINSMTLSTSNTITTLQGPGSTIQIFYNGVLISSWDGTNNGGLPVTNGNYRIQIDNMGQSGTVTSVSQNAIVNRSLSNILANVYNSAGEEVRTLYYLVDDPVGSSMTNVTLSSSTLRPTGVLVNSAAASITNGTTNLAAIYIETSGTPVTLIWDGTNNGGSVVSPGVYTINVHWNDGTGQTTNISREIIVMAGYSTSGSVVAQPNILNTTNGYICTFNANGVQNANAISVKIYTAAGEWIRTLNTSPGSLEVPWNTDGMASGLYIAAVEIQNVSGGVMGRQRLKVLLIH